MRNRIFFIDPQSMSNLAEYDYSVTHEMNCNIIYLCSKYYDYEINPKLTYIPIFEYNHKKNCLTKTVSYINSLLCIIFYTIKYKPALVHIQWFKIPKIDYYFWKILKETFHFQVIHTAHNLLPHNTGEKYKHIYGNIYSKLADKTIVHSSNTKKELTKLFGIAQDKVIVIRHGLLNMKFNEERFKEISQNSNYKEFIKDKIVSSCTVERYSLGCLFVFNQLEAYLPFCNPIV